MAKNLLTHDNENETWTSIGLAALRVLESSKEHQRDGERQTPEQRSEEEKAESHRKAVEHGLRETAKFERRFDPDYRSRRKRN